MDYPSPENYLTTRCAPDNRQAYDGKACFALIEKGNAAKSLQESIPYYQQAEDVLFKDLPVIPLWNWQDAAGYSKRLGNVNMDPYLYPLVRLDQVTVT
jgi:oligopeptide transport system substrate-binding protein